MSEKKEVSKPTRGNNSRKSFMPKTGSFIPQLIDSFASLEEGEITEKLAVKENKAERIAKSILPQKEKKPQPQLPPQPQMPRQKKPLSKQEIEELPVGRPAPADHAVHTQQKQQRQPQGAQHAQSHQSNTPTSAQPHQQPRKSGGQSAHPQVHTLASETTVALAAARQIGEELKKPFKGRNFGKGKDTVKIIPLGGLGEIGKNITLVEYKNDIVIIDCGLAFPEDEMLGIDLVIPDFSYVIKNKDKVRGIVITHGHEDHIGSLSYLLKEVNVPVYSARLTIGLVEGKLKEAGILAQSKLNVVKAGDKIKLGALTVEFIAVNHSIPDSCALAITTPVGVLIHTGDFKIDYTPVDGVMIDLARFGELGKKGVLALMSDSTNAEKTGATPSERNVGTSFETLFQKAGDKRIIIASFSSNIHRIQQVFNVAKKFGRRVIISGRSMENVTTIARDLGYLKVDPDALIDIDKMRNVPDSELVIITTGSQGEPMSALTRMARGDHRKISVTANDFIIISAMPIPGNEKLVGKVINDLMQMGCDVIYEDTMGIHVSGHARREEIKAIIGLTRPKFFIPVHGEYKHLCKNRELAMEMGIASDNIIVADIGKVIELSQNDVKMQTSVQSGAIMIDGSGVGDVGSVVLRDRKSLSEEGLVVATIAVNHSTGKIIAGPDIVSRGFVYVRDSEVLMDGAKEVCRQAVSSAIESRKTKEFVNIKQIVKEQLSGYLYSKTKRRPVILPIIQDVKL